MGAVEIFNVFAIYPDGHVSITMPHDPGNPKGVFATTQSIGCEAVPGLFHFPIVKTGMFKSWPPYLTPNPSGSMIHGRQRGVSLNFQAKIPTARMPNMMPIILGSI